ncbi:MAG: biopolymer transporter ExbD [Gammaproteobacteria bacterium]|nr:biopolymer transporter ExbD [Gammaproteobacteria bacterium]
MKESRRTERMIALNKYRKDRGASLNMVSLMDIFTILVFFLLVTSSNSETLPSSKTIHLPKSTTEKQPKKTLVVMVNEKDIKINGKYIIGTQEATDNKKTIIPELAFVLIKYAKKQPVKKQRYNVTVMGDKEIPYKLLKKIMITCAGTKFANISLAVVRKQVEKI